MNRDVRHALALSLALLAPLAGCGPDRIDGFDANPNRDVTAADMGARTDVRPDGPVDVPAADAPRDVVTPRDVVVPRDVAPPRDVPSGTMCPSACNTDDECATMCPAAASGNVNCCLMAPGGGTCYQNPGACPGGTGDGGTTPDGFGGTCLFTICMGDSDCTMCGAGYHCLLLGTIGICSNM